MPLGTTVQPDRGICFRKKLRSPHTTFCALCVLPHREGRSVGMYIKHARPHGTMCRTQATLARTLTQVPTSSAQLKLLTPQNCSILYKYARHLLLTNKKSLWSRQPAYMNKSSYDWKRPKKTPPTQLCLGLCLPARPARSCVDWVAARPWQVARREGGRGRAGGRGSQEVDSAQTNGKRCGYSRGRAAPGAAGEAGAASPGGRGPGRQTGTQLRLTVSNRRPAADGFRLPSQRLRANSIYLEKAGRKISFPSAPVSE